MDRGEDCPVLGDRSQRGAAHDSQREPQVPIPVICPRCGGEALSRMTVSLIADALITGRRPRLVSPCHGAEWDASDAEIAQIRDYLRAGCIADGSGLTDRIPEDAIPRPKSTLPRDSADSSRPAYRRHADYSFPRGIEAASETRGILGWLIDACRRR